MAGAAAAWPPHSRPSTRCRRSPRPPPAARALRARGRLGRRRRRGGRVRHRPGDRRDAGREQRRRPARPDLRRAARRSRRCTPAGVAASPPTLATYELFEQPGALGERRSASAATRSPSATPPRRIARARRRLGRATSSPPPRCSTTSASSCWRLYGDEAPRRPASDARGALLARERRELGIDHALVGGVLTRRWGLPTAIAARDRAPPRRRRRGPGRGGPARRPGRPPRRRRHGLRRGAARGRRGARDRARTRSARCSTSSRTPARRASARRAVPAVAARGRRPARARRGQGLQGDRPGDGPLGEHRAHPPPQRLPQDRRRRPRPGRPRGPRTRLDLSYRSGESRSAIATAWARSRASRRGRPAFAWVRTVSVLSPRRFALVGRVAVGEQLQDLALAAGDRARTPRSMRRRGR